MSAPRSRISLLLRQTPLSHLLAALLLASANTPASGAARPVSSPHLSSLVAGTGGQERHASTESHIWYGAALGGRGVHSQRTVAPMLKLRGGGELSLCGDVESGEQRPLDHFSTDEKSPGATLRGGGVDRPARVLLGLSGSVAAIKAEELVKALSAFADVRVVTTAKAAHFFSPEALTEACHVEVLTDADEWAAWQGRGDPVQHIELRRWADLFLIAPTSVRALLPRSLSPAAFTVLHA